MLKSILAQLNEQPLFPQIGPSRRSPHAVRSTLIYGACLIMLCAFLAWLRWGKLGTFWDDGGRWLYEAYRLSEGEMMYRDFSWLYPPLSLFIFGAAFWLVGSTFLVAQLLLNALSVIFVLLTWLVGRQLLPERLALFVAAAIAIAGTTYESVFALFSLQLYTPALLTGGIGMQLMLLGIFGYLRHGTMKPSTWLSLILGCSICLLSKPEFILGSLGSLAVLALADTQLHFKDLAWKAWFLRYLLLFIVTIVPAAACYSVLIHLVGFDNLLAGVTGYGVAANICPWWPTGLGLLSVAAALAEGFCIIALLMITLRHSFFGQRDSILHIAKGGLIFGSVVIALNLLTMLDTAKPSHVVLFDAANRLTSTFEGLLPAMWWSIALWILLVGHSIKGILQHSRVAANSVRHLIILTPFILLSARGLFNGLQAETSHIPAVATPFWPILAPYLILLCLGTPNLRSDVHLKTKTTPRLSGLTTVACLIVSYVAVRAIIGLVATRDTTYTPLQTEAGLVQVSDHGLSARVYDYVIANTRPHDYILDLNHGGGVYMATRRRSPIFSTEFDFRPSEQILNRDLSLFNKQRPTLVIGNDKPNLGTSYGVTAYTGCTFPRILWRSHRPSFDSTKTLPLVENVQSEYRPRSRIDHIVIYERK